MRAVTAEGDGRRGLPIDKIYHPAVLVSALVYFVLGRLWFGPLFGARWESIANVAPMQQSTDPVPAIVSAAMSLVLSYTIAVLLALTRGRASASSGAALGLLVGVGVAASSMLATILREGRPGLLWLLDAGYIVAGCLLIGAIVGAWKRSDVL